MRRHRGLTFVASCAASVGVASAADLPTFKAPPAPVPIAPAFSWTGPYFGAVVGYGWADPTSGYAVTSASLAALPPIIPVIDAAGSRPLFIGGGEYGFEGGYNWQVSSFAVLGVEADFEGGHVAGSHEVGGTVPNFGIPFTITQGLNIDWQGSLRARAGVLARENLLIYAIGGVAFANLNYTTSYYDPAPELESKSIRQVKAGWTLGGGVEYAIDAHWSLKGEYVYSQFSAATGTGSGVLTDGTTAYVAHSTGMVGETSARLGLNYRF